MHRDKLHSNYKLQAHNYTWKLTFKRNHSVSGLATAQIEASDLLCEV